MFSWIVFRWKIWRLDRAERSVEAAYAKDRKEKQASGLIADVFRSHEAEHFELLPILDERNILRSNRLVHSALAVGLPIPEWNDATAWTESKVLGTHYLTTKAYADLRSAVRKERNETW